MIIEVSIEEIKKWLVADEKLEDLNKKFTQEKIKQFIHTKYYMLKTLIILSLLKIVLKIFI